MKNQQSNRKKINKSFIPNIFTLLNMYLGFSAIILIISGDPVRAGWFVFFAALFDAFDGKLARLFGIDTTFGTEFDSFADTISFCVTSSLLIYTTWTKGLIPVIAILISFIPIIFGTIRLARFNIISDHSQKYQIIGLPTPLYALAIFGFLLFSNAGFGTYGDPNFALILSSILGVAMISRIKFDKIPHLSVKKGFNNNVRLILGLAIFVSIIIWQGLVIFPVIILYIIISTIKWIMQLGRINAVEGISPSRNGE